VTSAGEDWQVADVRAAAVAFVRAAVVNDVEGLNAIADSSTVDLAWGVVAFAVQFGVALHGRDGLLDLLAGLQEHQMQLTEGTCP